MPKLSDVSLRVGTAEAVAAYLGTTPVWNSASLVLDFLNAGPLDPRITFTRASAGTYWGSDGLLKTALTNAPRFDHDPATLQPRGLLIEGQSTNLLTNPRDMSQSAWAKLDTTAVMASVGITGDVDSATLITEGTAGNATTGQNGGAVSAGTPVSATCFIERGNTDWLKVYLSDNSTSHGVSVWVNLATGTKGNQTVSGSATAASSSVRLLANGFCKVTLTCIPNSTYTVPRLSWSSASANGVSTRVPNATYIVDCTQLEVGAFATSPIIAGASQATRAADVPLLPLVGSSWLQNTGSGTFVFDLDTSNSEAYSNWWDAAPTSNQFSMRHAAKNTCEGSIFGVWVTGAIPGITGAGGRIKAAVAFSPSEAVLVVNGGVVASVAMTGSTIFTTTALHIGKASWGVSAGQIRDAYRGMRYLAGRKPTAQLQALTAP